MTPDEKREKFSGMADATEEALGRVLTPRQAERLRQVYRQVQGPLVFTEPDVVEALSLTVDQRDRIRAVQTEFRDARFRRGPRGGPAGETWQGLSGEPFTGRVFSPDRPFGPPPGPGPRPGGPPGGSPPGGPPPAGPSPAQ
jgi:hypothetical protein